MDERVQSSETSDTAAQGSEHRDGAPPVDLRSFVMSLTDATGHRLSGANPSGLAHFEQAAHELLCLVDDPVGSIDRAIEASPGMTMAHLLKAWLHLLGTEPGGLVVAKACLAAAAALDADERERGHLDAAKALAAGRWREAALRIEDINMRCPRDTLALQVGHQIDFFRGDSRMLRDRIARVLPAWDPAVPGWHAVLGMHAFGLEETGDYAAAEARGRRSVELEPRDSWGWHAVAHVHEMRNAPRDGIAWLEPSRATWSKGSFLGTHNAWHLALCQLELDRHDEVLRLYDEAIGGGQQRQVDQIALRMAAAEAMRATANRPQQHRRMRKVAGPERLHRKRRRMADVARERRVVEVRPHRLLLRFDQRMLFARTIGQHVRDHRVQVVECVAAASAVRGPSLGDGRAALAERNAA